MADEMVKQEAEGAAEEKAKVTEMVMCAVSKQQVPLDETVEIERKRGEKLRIHARFKKF